MKLKTGMTLCCFMMLLAACIKNPKYSPTAEKLMAGKWQVTSLIGVYEGAWGKDTIDHFKTWDPCEQDDYLVFLMHDEGVLSDGGHGCPGNEQVRKFSWRLRTRDEIVEIPLQDGRTRLYNLTEVSDKQLRWWWWDYNTSQTIYETLKNTR